MIGAAQFTSRLRIDEISRALGDPRHLERPYFRELRDQVLGSHSRDLLGVSRLYWCLKPQVAVDFEPAPGDGKFYVDEKRRFLAERGIVYVPIFRGERLTMDQFLRRVREERGVMEEVRRDAGENRALVRAATQVPASPPTAALDLDRLALQRLQEEIARNTHLRGASRAKRLAAIRLALAAHLPSEAARYLPVLCSQRAVPASGGSRADRASPT